MSWLRDVWRALGNVEEPTRHHQPLVSVEDYINMLNSFQYSGNLYTLGGGVKQTLTGHAQERIPNTLEGYATHAYQMNGVVFSCMLTRMMVFSAVRFTWQKWDDQGRPSEMFSTPGLQVLDEPWQGGTTQDLLTRMILDADLCGNSYWTLIDDELIRLRPDWVGIILEPRTLPRVKNENGKGPAVVGYRRVAYTYQEGGYGSSHDPVILPLEHVAHFAPNPDPLATYRGMSPLTPVLREVRGDRAMMEHKQRFMDNGATPNMIVSLPKEVTYETFKKFKTEMEQDASGVKNAYKTLYLAGGADVEVVGNDFKQIDFKQVQGHGETRIAAAFGVPPVIVGLSEGLQAATYSNYSQARRRFADGTMHPLWQNAVGSLRPLLPNKDKKRVRLWYDARDVPFLREDRKDAAEIQKAQSESIRSLVDAGFEADSVVRAIESEDFGLLKHSGLFSIQLQPPGTVMDPFTGQVQGPNPNPQHKPAPGSGAQPQKPMGAGAQKPTAPKPQQPKPQAGGSAKKPTNGGQQK